VGVRTVTHGWVQVGGVPALEQLLLVQVTAVTPGSVNSAVSQTVGDDIGHMLVGQHVLQPLLTITPVVIEHVQPHEQPQIDPQAPAEDPQLEAE
jgi:hypothetical protein